MDLPNRKNVRLKYYDYGTNGAYFVTICTQNNKPLLGTIHPLGNDDVGRWLAAAEDLLTLSDLGLICEQELFELEKRYEYVKIGCYVIMPTHIHVIIILNHGTAAASHRPTKDDVPSKNNAKSVLDIVGAFKSLATIKCNKFDNAKGRKIFQTSFYEKIIRDEKSYLTACKYIDENPQKWELDKYYTKL